MKTTQTRVVKGGFTLVEIMIVVAIIGMLTAIAVPNFMKARANSQASSCINNLREIDTAVQQVAFEQNKHAGDVLNYPGDITPYIKLNVNLQIPPCPAGGNYVLSPVGINPSVSCSLGSTVTPAHSY